MTVSPPFGEAALPRFDVLEPQRLADHVQECLRIGHEQLTALEGMGDTTYEALVGGLERMTDPIERGWDTLMHLLAVRNSEELRRVHEALQPEVVAFHLRVAQSFDLHQSFSALRPGRDWEGLTQAGKRISRNHQAF